eukprot:356188-Chlamydomonas_euryale.AAC.3
MASWRSQRRLASALMVLGLVCMAVGILLPLVLKSMLEAGVSREASTCRGSCCRCREDAALASDQRCAACRDAVKGADMACCGGFDEASTGAPS